MFGWQQCAELLTTKKINKIHQVDSFILLWWKKCVKLEMKCSLTLSITEKGLRHASGPVHIMYAKSCFGATLPFQSHAHFQTDQPQP